MKYKLEWRRSAFSRRVISGTLVLLATALASWLAGELRGAK